MHWVIKHKQQILWKNRFLTKAVYRFDSFSQLSTASTAFTSCLQLLSDGLYSFYNFLKACSRIFCGHFTLAKRLPTSATLLDPIAISCWVMILNHFTKDEISNRPKSFRYCLQSIPNLSKTLWKPLKVRGLWQRDSSQNAGCCFRFREKSELARKWRKMKRKRRKKNRRKSPIGGGGEK